MVIGRIKWKGYLLLNLEIMSWLMVDLNITSCQPSVFRIKLLWLYSFLEVSESQISVCLCMVLRKWVWNCKFSFHCIIFYMTHWSFHRNIRWQTNCLQKKSLSLSHWIPSHSKPSPTHWRFIWECFCLPSCPHVFLIHLFSNFALLTTPSGMLTVFHLASFVYL